MAVGLRPNLAEEGRQMIILGLGPPLEGMMMTLRALHAHAEEKLRHILQLRGAAPSPAYTKRRADCETMVPVEARIWRTIWS